MTYPEDKLSEIMDIAADYESPVGADFVGLHLEGPFINPNRVGAQNSDYVQKARCRYASSSAGACKGTYSNL